MNRAPTRREAMAGMTMALASPAAAFAQPQAAGPSVTMHESEIRGRSMRYRAAAGEYLLRNAAGSPRATMFSVSYTLVVPRTAAERPVTFLFNGGPLSSSRAMHEGLAPRVLGSKGASPDIVANPDSLLDASDLVFIDPPGTGYTRFVAEDAKPEYWGIEQDAAAFSNFIAQWLAANGRAASPKFLIGSSYSGARLGQLARMLSERPTPIHLRGVVLVSPGLGTGSQNPMAGQADQPTLTLPSQAATARFHGRGAHLGGPPTEVFEAARRFADGPYAAAMGRRASLTRVERAQIAAQIADFIGLDAATVEAENLFVPVPKFMTALLADQGLRLDLGDGRKAAPATPTVAASRAGGEPAIDAFFRRELGYEPRTDYVTLSVEANRSWNNATTRRPDFVPAIFKAMTATDPQLHLMLIGGCYDLNVPFNLPLTRYLQANLPDRQFRHHLYATGHSVFDDGPSRPQSTDDVRAFYRAALGRSM